LSLAILDQAEYYYAKGLPILPLPAVPYRLAGRPLHHLAIPLLVLLFPPVQAIVIYQWRIHCAHLSLVQPA
jgi:hypothetical protein